MRERQEMADTRLSGFLYKVRGIQMTRIQGRIAILLFLLVIMNSGPSLAIDLPNDALLMFGESPPSMEVVSLRREFINSAVQETGSRELAALAFLSKAWSFMELGQFTESMRQLNRAWLLAPESREVYRGFGANLGRSGRYDDSIRMYEKARALGPVSAELLSEFAEPYNAKADVSHGPDRDAYADKAILLSREALELNPKLGPAYFNWAMALYYKTYYVESTLRVNRALALDEDCVNEAFARDLESRLIEQYQLRPDGEP